MVFGGGGGGVCETVVGGTVNGQDTSTEEGGRGKREVEVVMKF